MKVLVVGGGGREHALAWKIAQSPLVKKTYCAPGNPGIARQAECVPLRADDLMGIFQFVRDKGIDLTVIGPEDPLTLGLSDKLSGMGFKVFGPSAAAAEIEGSKVFAKQLMKKNGIPTAAFRVFEDAHDAHGHIDTVEPPLVVKADGLAKGKGVIVCRTRLEAHEAVREIMTAKIFGRSGDRVVIEDCLKGEEVSLLAITDGKNIIALAPAQDHKAIFDGDRGPNTGGMGAYSPVPQATAALCDEVERRVLVPTIHGMRREGRRYQGCLYAGLMLTSNGPQVLEYNARFGDPETQPIMMRMKSDIVPLLLASAEGALGEQQIEWDARVAVSVVMASAGYPGNYEKGFPIEGLAKVEMMRDVMVFHAGTAESGGKPVTAGGRVLSVTALGDTVHEAQRRAYEAVSAIHFQGAQYRTDIGNKALR